MEPITVTTIMATVWVDAGRWMPNASASIALSSPASAANPASSDTFQAVRNPAAATTTALIAPCVVESQCVTVIDNSCTTAAAIPKMTAGSRPKILFTEVVPCGRGGRWRPGVRFGIRYVR